MVETDPAYFARALRQLRGSRSLRALEASQELRPGAAYLSKSQLARYESGATLPPIKNAAHLDDLYAAGGWIIVTVGNLWRASWNPLSNEADDPKLTHAFRWPADYSGTFWIKVKPLPRNAGGQHTFTFDWGPWRAEVETAIDSAGILFITGKGKDELGEPVTCNLSVSKPSYVLIGTGESLPDERTLNIKHRWSWRT